MSAAAARCRCWGAVQCRECKQAESEGSANQREGALVQQLAFYMLNSMLWVQAEAAVQVSAPAGVRNGEQRASFTSWVHGSTCDLVQARWALEVECLE